jgi:hypothetical protein
MSMLLLLQTHAVHTAISLSTLHPSLTCNEHGTAIGKVYISVRNMNPCLPALVCAQEAPLWRFRARDLRAKHKHNV